MVVLGDLLLCYRSCFFAVTDFTSVLACEYRQTKLIVALPHHLLDLAFMQSLCVFSLVDDAVYLVLGKMQRYLRWWIMVDVKLQTV